MNINYTNSILANELLLLKIIIIGDLIVVSYIEIQINKHILGNIHSTQCNFGIFKISFCKRYNSITS